MLAWQRKIRSRSTAFVARAIASGISASNVRDYLADARVFLVASSIEDSFGVIHYDRAARLADLIHRPT